MALRCLLVDDDAPFLESARALLELEGIAVDTASTGAQAVRRAGELRPDFVLLDLRLGTESGFEVAREIQKAWPSAGPSQDGPRIIFISTIPNRTSDDSSRRVQHSGSSPNPPSRPGPSENCLGAQWTSGR